MMLLQRILFRTDDRSSDRKSRGSTGVALNSLADSTSKTELELGANSAGIDETSSNTASPLLILVCPVHRFERLKGYPMEAKSTT